MNDDDDDALVGEPIRWCCTAVLGFFRSCYVDGKLRHSASPKQEIIRVILFLSFVFF
jgi:hypothetical protein